MLRTDHLQRRVPLWLKLAYTAFVAVHVVINWQAYGPIDFLWSCDVAVLVLLVAVWTESRLLLSIEAVAILFPLLLWGFDLACRLVMGKGHYPLGFAGYMFDPRVPRSVRMLSSFHIWLPIVIVYLLMRLGYDRRAFFMQSIIVMVLMVGCRMLTPPPPATAAHRSVNINWVYGPSDERPQEAVPAAVYLTLMILLYQLMIYLPTHLVLSGVFASAPAGREPHRAASSTPILV